MADTTRIPIDFTNPGVSANAGNAWFAPEAMSTPTPDFDAGVWHMLEDVESRLYGFVTVPNTIGGTPAAKIILQFAANSTAGSAVSRIQVSTRAVADNEDLNGSMTAETEVSVTMPTTAYRIEEYSRDMTTDPAAKDLLMVEVFHDGDDAADTLAVPTLLVRGFLEIDLS